MLLYTREARSGAGVSWISPEISDGSLKYMVFLKTYSINL